MNESEVATLSLNGLHVMRAFSPRFPQGRAPNDAIFAAFTNASPARFTSQSSGFVTYTPLSQENDATKPANPGIGFSASTRISFRPAFNENVALVGVRQPSYCERTLLFCSATPSTYEEEHELLRTEQVIRPTGLLDPEVDVRPTEGQVDDLIGEIRKATDKEGKVLVTTLTKRMAEDLTDYLRNAGIRVKYLHSDIDTLERAQIIRDMRLDVFDVLVGINLLREGLDIPEIRLVAILDADKEGFLRSETSLIQTIGRAARNADGHVVMYADNMTESMDRAIRETKRRRAIQEKYNEEHGITPTTIRKAVRDLISISKAVSKEEARFEKDPESMSRSELEKLIDQVEKQMRRAAADLNFEAAAELRDRMTVLKKHLLEITGGK